MHAAVYARVSTERQERYATIDSQLAALHAWAAATGHDLADEHVFRKRGTAAAASTNPASTRCAMPCAMASSAWWPY